MFTTPRKAREKSVTGIYHVMLRGINQQQIFIEDEDYKDILEAMLDKKISKTQGDGMFYHIVPSVIE